MHLTSIATAIWRLQLCQNGNNLKTSNHLRTFAMVMQQQLHRVHSRTSACGGLRRDHQSANPLQEPKKNRKSVKAMKQRAACELRKPARVKVHVVPNRWKSTMRGFVPECVPSRHCPVESSCRFMLTIATGLAENTSRKQRAITLFLSSLIGLPEICLKPLQTLV